MQYKNNHYYSFSQYLNDRFHKPIYKATIDAGFICPNMDGSKGTGGCTFCNNASFSPAFRVRKENIQEQIIANIDRMHRMRKKIALSNPGFIAFFQAFSGTYGPIEVMKEWYHEALSFPSVVGISVATRCDCLSKEVLELFTELASNHQEVWLEIGIESTYDATLELINRGHTYKEVVDSVKEIKKINNLKLCVHLIHGLPTESKEMMLESVRKMNLLKPDAIKFHHLEIVKDTVMEKQFHKGEVKVLKMEEYFEILGKSIQILDPEIIIQRLFSVSPEEYLVAPIYDIKGTPHNLFLLYLKKHGIVQGSHFNQNL